MKNEIIDTHTDRNGNKWKRKISTNFVGEKIRSALQERKESRSSWKNFESRYPAIAGFIITGRKEKHYETYRLLHDRYLQV